MNQQEQIIYFLGQIKTSIEFLGFIARKEKSSELLILLTEFESEFNQQMKKIFSY